MNKIIAYTKNLCLNAANHKRLFLLLLIFSMASIADIPTAPIYSFSIPKTIAYIICIGAFKAYVLLLFSTFLMERNRLLKALCISAIAIYGLLSLVNISCYYFYGFGITRRLFIIIGQSNPKEIIEFMPGLVDNMSALMRNKTAYATLAAIIFAFLLIKRIPTKIFSYIASCLSTIGGIMLIWFCSTYTYGRQRISYASG